MTVAHDLPLILASSSPYRRQLLGRLGLPFEAVSPDLDETRLAGETPAQMTARLATGKAHTVRRRHAPALIIGSDQTAELDGMALGKPGTHARAVSQLEQLSGQKVRFHTSVCLLNSVTGQEQLDVIPYDVQFRLLQRHEIEHYLLSERPYDCAGSFRSEGLGIALFEHLSGDDPSALIGLPLIRLCQMLAQAGRPVL